jgi:hypothetical protein
MCIVVSLELRTGWFNTPVPRHRPSSPRHFITSPYPRCVSISSAYLEALLQDLGRRNGNLSVNPVSGKQGLTGVNRAWRAFRRQGAFMIAVEGGAGRQAGFGGYWTIWAVPPEGRL